MIFFIFSLTKRPFGEYFLSFLGFWKANLSFCWMLDGATTWIFAKSFFSTTSIMDDGCAMLCFFCGFCWFFVGWCSGSWGLQIWRMCWPSFFAKETERLTALTNQQACLSLSKEMVGCLIF